MLTERGRVVAVEQDSAWVETLRESACGQCSARAGCGHGLLNSALPGSSRALVRARLPETLRRGVRVHDEVELSLPEGRFLRAAALLYLMPLLGGVVAAVTGDRLLVGAGTSQASADLIVGICAVGGLAMGLLLLRFLTRQGSGPAASEPVITARI